MALYALQERAPEMAKLTRVTRDEDELAKLRVPGALGAVITEVAARMWPYKLVARILEDLLTQDLPGGDFNLQTLTPVTRLGRSSASSWRVETDRGAIEAKKVVLATNAYTSHLLPSFASLIVPVRGQMSALDPLPSLKDDNRLKTSFGFAGDGIDDYLIQRPNESGGHLMFGGGRQFQSCVGVTDDSEIDDKTAKYLRTRLLEALGLPERTRSGGERCSCAYCRGHEVSHHHPSIHYTLPPSIPSSPVTKVPRQLVSSPPFSPLSKNGEKLCSLCLPGRICRPAPSTNTSSRRRVDEFKATHEWTGIMGFSRDDLPWIGPVPASLLPTSPPHSAERETGLFLAAGFTGHGMPNTWLCGKGVAEMVCGAVPGETGVPEAYLMSEERVERARGLESVAARDWAEMERGAAARAGKGEGRPHSGYA